MFVAQMNHTGRLTILLLTLIPHTASHAGEEKQASAAKTGLDTSVEAGSIDQLENGADEYLLRYRFLEGEIIRYRSQKVGELCLTVAGASKSDVERVEQVRRFLVTHIDESGLSDLVMQFEKIEMSRQVNDDPPIVFRSTMKPSEVPPMFARFADRLRRGAPQFAVMPTGTPTNESDEIRLPEKTDAPETRLMPPLPEAPVQIGESWSYITPVKVRMAEEITRKIRLLTTCRLESVENGIARIKFSTSPERRLKSVLARSQLVSARPQGYFLMDIETGRINKRVIRNRNSVHGVRGPQSLVTYSSESVEELL